MSTPARTLAEKPATRDAKGKVVAYGYRVTLTPSPLPRGAMADRLVEIMDKFPRTVAP